MLQCVAVLYCSVMQCVAVCCSVLQCVAVCYNVLQCAAELCCGVVYLKMRVNGVKQHDICCALMVAHIDYLLQCVAV